MNVSIKDFQVDMSIKNNGIELEVRSPQGRHLGDLCIGRGTIEWCSGRTRRGRGKRISWENLIEFFKNSK
jgi:hypothetical protein